MAGVVLGVDGGNTKADFCLYDRQGILLAHLRTGTCSHEALGGYDPAEKALDAGIAGVCAKAKVTRGELTAAVFGLAGADIPGQQRELERRCRRLVDGKLLVCNDSLLGIKAGTPQGVGVCCINGTGTVVSGIGQDGGLCQVGGIGPVTSDYAGGGFAAQEVLRRVYSHCCRDGLPTAMTEGVLRLLEMPADGSLLAAIHPDNLPPRALEYELGLLLFDCARAGDGVARQVLAEMGRTLAQSTAGCVKQLAFPDEVWVVLAGSLWVKEEYPALREGYRQELERRVGRPCHLQLLEEPPALGAALWAWQLDGGRFPDKATRNKMAAGWRRANKEAKA